MKFTPSSALVTALNSINIRYMWRVYIRKSNDITLPLDTGTWTEVTDDLAELPVLQSSLELREFVYRSDSISLTGLGIGRWNQLVFDVAEEYVELKIELQINDLSNERAVMFAGVIDKDPDRIEIAYRQDIINFDVRSYENLTELMATDIVERPIVEISSIDMLELKSIPGLFVVKADISGHSLRRGVHRIEYRDDGGTRQARLISSVVDARALTDAGDWTNLVNNLSVDLSDQSGSIRLNEQQVRVYFRQAYSSNQASDQEIIVLQSGEVLPYTWLQNISLDEAVKIIIEKTGITEIKKIGDIDFKTYDDRAIITWRDRIQSVSGVPRKTSATIKIGDHIYVALENVIWRKDLSTGDWEEFLSSSQIGSTNTVVRMWYSALNNLMPVLLKRSNDTYTIGVYRLASSSWGINDMERSMRENSWVLFEASGVASIAYLAGNQLRVFDCVMTPISGADSLVLTDADIRTGGCFRNPDHSKYFYYMEDSILGWLIFSIDRSGSGFSSGSVTLVSDEMEIQYVFRECEINDNDGHAYGNATLPNLTSNFFRVFDISNGNWTSLVSNITILGAIQRNDGLHFLAKEQDASPGQLEARKVNNKTYSDIGDGAVFFPMQLLHDRENIFRDNAFDHDGNITGINLGYPSYLFSRSSEFDIYLHNECRFDEKTIKQALSEIFNAWLMAYKVTAEKKLQISRRFDNVGDLIGEDTGITLNNDMIGSPSVRASDLPVIEIAEVQAKYNHRHYDGTNFRQGSHFDTGDINFIQINNGIIFDAPGLEDGLVNDIAFFLRKYVSRARRLYHVVLASPIIPYLEIGDKVHLDFDVHGVAVDAPGVVIGIDISMKSMSLNILTIE